MLYIDQWFLVYSLHLIPSAGCFTVNHDCMTAISLRVTTCHSCSFLSGSNLAPSWCTLRCFVANLCYIDSRPPWWRNLETWPGVLVLIHLTFGKHFCEDITGWGFPRRVNVKLRYCIAPFARIQLPNVDLLIWPGLRPVFCVTSVDLIVACLRKRAKTGK